MKNAAILLFLTFPFVSSGCGSEQSIGTKVAESEEDLVARALEIHDRVLTVDTHADTPLRMIEPNFDMSERQDPKETGSKVD